MRAQRKDLLTGVALFAGFTAVLVIIFMPLLNGKNLIQYLDELYNSISKGSVYYIPALQEEMQSHTISPVNVSIELDTEQQAAEVSDIIAFSGAQVSLSGSTLTVSGKLTDILSNALEDSDFLFHNQVDEIYEKYGYHGRKVLYNWWIALKSLDKELTRLKRFQDAKIVSTVLKKGVECSYNYYRIEPLNISDEVLMVVLSLVFYVIYTVWFGFAIMYLLMGLGFRLEH